MLGGVLNQFLFDVAWPDLDYLIIDLPPGTGDMQLSMVQSTEIDGVVVVSTPQDVAILDSRKGLNMFNQVKIPILGMVENMSYFVPDDAPGKKYFIFGEGGVKKAAAELNVNLLAEIPLELALREMTNLLEVLKEQASFGFTGKVNLLLVSNGQFLGVIYLHEGFLVGANYGQLSGKNALFNMIFEDVESVSHFKFIVEPELVGENLLAMKMSYDEVKQVLFWPNGVRSLIFISTASLWNLRLRMP